MKKRSSLLTVVLLGTLVLALSVAYAQPPGSAPPDMEDELGLTEEQIENIKEIQYNFKKIEIGLRADLKTSRLELRHLMMQEKPSKQEITRLVDKIAETQKALLRHNVDKKLAMKEILTQAQFEKFMKMKGERRKGMMRKEGRFRRQHTRDFRSHGRGPGF
jgi:Spy/CpxP family protein refolding chaperone